MRDDEVRWLSGRPWIVGFIEGADYTLNTLNHATERFELSQRQAGAAASPQPARRSADAFSDIVMAQQTLLALIPLIAALFQTLKSGVRQAKAMRSRTEGAEVMCCGAMGSTLLSTAGLRLVSTRDGWLQ